MRHIQRYLFIKRYVLPSGIAILILTALWPRISQSQDNPPGASLSGLNPGDRTLFDVGRDGFLEVESVAAGLGPAFNGTSCAGCHNQPAIGGFGNAAVIRAGTIWNGRYRVPQGGDLVHFFSIPDHACQPGVPANANNVIRRIPTPLFGAGLVEAIPDSAIEALADPTDRNGDGIHGRIAFIMDPATQTIRVGRFGWKAQHATLLAFAANAYRDEMGITNDLYPEEIGTALSPGQLAACDTVPDPEDKPDPITHLRDIDKLANFMRFLAPIEPLPQSDNLRRGAELFASVGCVFCHVPALQTGSSPIAALDGKQWPLIPTSCCMMLEPATESSKAQPWEPSFGPLRCGAYGSVNCCCTTVGH